MSNTNCPVGSANKAKIEAHEKRIEELARSIEEMLKRFEKSQQLLLEQLNRLHHEFTRRFDEALEKLVNRPSWAVMLLLSGLSSLCVGLLVYLISTKTQ